MARRPSGQPKYLFSAPATLIELHEHRLAKPSLSRFDPKKTIADAQRKHGVTLSAEQIERLRAQLNRMLFMPEREATELLGRLLTDERMRRAWTALARRIKEDRGFRQLNFVIEGAIMQWRGELKLTRSQRKKLFKDIRSHAGKLLELMACASEFHLYSITSFLTDEGMKWLAEVTDTRRTSDLQHDIDYLRFSVADTLPSVQDVLIDIGKRAEEYGKKAPLAGKPRAKNAAANFLARRLSAYFIKECRQPLHDVVAAITSVTFDLHSFDGDSVRKLVRS